MAFLKTSIEILKIARISYRNLTAQHHFYFELDVVVEGISKYLQYFVSLEVLI